MNWVHKGGGGGDRLVPWGGEGVQGFKDQIPVHGGDQYMGMGSMF